MPSQIPEVGEILENVLVNIMGKQGDGIIKTDIGFVVFVKGVSKGDVVTVKVTRVFEKYAFADLVSKNDGTKKSAAAKEEVVKIITLP